MATAHGERRRNQVFIDLAKRQGIHATLEEALRDVAIASAEELDADRVSVWLMNDDREAMRCAETYDRRKGQHGSGGEEIAIATQAVFFRSLENERFVKTPGGILHAAVWRAGELAGMVRHESAPEREWSPEDESFAGAVADLVSMALGAAMRRAAEQRVDRRVALEHLIANISTQFINLPAAGIEEAITDALRSIAEFVGAKRAFINLLGEGAKVTLGYEWGDSTARPRDYPAGAFAWTIDRMRDLRHLEMLTDEIPPEASADRALYEAAGTRSLLAVPMIVNREPIAMLGVASDEPRAWSEEAASLLHIAGEIFAGALQRVRADEQLRASESRYRLLIERMREGVLQVDNDRVIQLVNDRFCELVGYGRAELVGRPIDFLLAFPEDLATAAAKSRLRMRGISDRYEVRIRRKDGTVIWMEIGGAPVTAADGRVIGSIGVHNDVTERRLAEQALRESEARYRLMAENSTDMIARTSRGGLIIYVSEACRRLLGYEPAEMIGRGVYEFIDPRDAEEVAQLSRLFHDSGPTTFSYRVRRKDGSLTWFETTSRSLTHPATGMVAEIVSVSRDVTERKHAEEQIEYQAFHDALTGLPNRRLFRDRLTVALAHARRSQQPLAVMFLDLDRFKYVNDTLGHSVGDELLKAIASRLKASVREEDSIARMGGDEFTVLLANLKKLDDVPSIANKLLDMVAQPIAVDGHDLFITTSIGVAVFPADGDTAEVLLKNADHAMYRAKDAGRSAVQLFTPAMNVRALERLSLENSLRMALEREELLLYYQPQILVATGEVVGMEALLRWRRPDYGVVEPLAFIPIAEETRLIVPIGAWVLREACRQAKSWHDSRFPGVRMSVNLSARQFQEPDLPDQIAFALEESGLDPRFLEVEITESLAMHNTDRTLLMLRRLREMGVQISVDDFGTGHSSLNYLRTFPIDSVKIDQQFVHEIETSAADRAIVAAVITMAHDLSLRVTAEGVETEAQMEFLRDHDCDEVQGYLFGRPEAP